MQSIVNVLMECVLATDDVITEELSVICRHHDAIADDVIVVENTQLPLT